MTEAVTDRGPPDESKQEKPSSKDDFLKQVVKRFSRVSSVESENRLEALDDLRFKAGDQWPEWAKAQRTLDKRPCLTINKIPTFVHQITNDQRQNRPAINISPIGDKGDPETAKMLKGLIRQIERLSHADVAYDTGFDSAVSMGWGYWRIIPEYESDNSFNQVLRIKRIRNAFRVYLDPDHQEPDGSDAQWGFITDLMIRHEFADKYPKANPVEWSETGIGDGYEEWSTQTHVRIAEYFCYELTKRRLLLLTNGHIGFYDELDPALKAEVDANPELIQKERDLEDKQVKWYTLTAHDILDETDWLGKWIPIIKVIGEEIDIEGKVILSGLARPAKDPQRMYNFWCTSETELIALAPKAPWVLEEGQVEGYENMWRDANTKSMPYLIYKGTNIGGKPAPPPQRQQFAGPPVGVVNAKIGAAQDMQAVTGIRFDATQQERMYDESGKALRELKRVGDLGNFHYVDNLSRSLRFTGIQLVDAIPKYYDTRRVLTILREDDSEEQIEINPQLGKPYEQKTIGDAVKRLYNPKIGEYAVTVTVGPNFATKRAEAADSMLAFMKAVPQSGPLIGDLIAKNMDWPGAEEIGSRLTPPHLADKGLEKLDPAARGIVATLTQQLQQTQQQLDTAAAMLGDKDKDLAIDQDKIDKDFQAKMAQIQAGITETVMKLQAETQQDNQAQLVKISKEFEARVMEMLLDFKLSVAELDLKREQATAEHQLNREATAEQLAMDRENNAAQVKIKQEQAKSKEPA